jgi:hypothetical protein
MPYKTNKDLPGYVKKKGKKKQRQWRHVWESVHKQTGDEGRAFAAANAVTKSFGVIYLRVDRPPAHGR